MICGNNPKSVIEELIQLQLNHILNSIIYICTCHCSTQVVVRHRAKLPALDTTRLHMTNCLHRQASQLCEVSHIQPLPVLLKVERNHSARNSSVTWVKCPVSQLLILTWSTALSVQSNANTGNIINTTDWNSQSFRYEACHTCHHLKRICELMLSNITISTIFFTNLIELHLTQCHFGAIILLLVHYY